MLIGVTFFFIQRLLESGAMVFDASPMVLAWLPTALLASWRWYWWRAPADPD